MREWQSQSHVRWYCRYHVVIVPKYRHKAIFGVLRKDIGRILREVCNQEAFLTHLAIKRHVSAST